MNMKNFEGFKRFFGRRKVLSEQYYRWGYEGRS